MIVNRQMWDAKQEGKVNLATRLRTLPQRGFSVELGRFEGWTSPTNRRNLRVKIKFFPDESLDSEHIKHTFNWWQNSVNDLHVLLKDL